MPNKKDKSFFTVINCIDGRVQVPVIVYLKKKFKVAYVDSITEPGVNALLSSKPNSPAARSIFKKAEISLKKHASSGIAVAGHADCAANPKSRSIQNAQTKKAVKLLAKKYPKVKILGLWVNANWKVEKI